MIDPEVTTCSSLNQTQVTLN